MLQICYDLMRLLEREPISLIARVKYRIMMVLIHMRYDALPCGIVLRVLRCHGTVDQASGRQRPSTILVVSLRDILGTFVVS